jgi:hypothetical protein
MVSTIARSNHFQSLTLTGLPLPGLLVLLWERHARGTSSRVKDYG